MPISTSLPVNRTPVGFMTALDDTAIEHAPLFSMKNLTKRGLPPKAGFLDFIHGAENTKVPFLGIISKRTPLRKVVTAQAIAYIGLPSRTPRTLAGSVVAPWTSAQRKAHEIVDMAHKTRTFGFVDAEPHKVGAGILATINRYLVHGPYQPPVNIVVAVPHHERAEEYVDTFGKQDGSYNANTVDLNGRPARSVRIGTSALTIVALEPYSAQEGQWFAGALQQVAA